MRALCSNAGVRDVLLTLAAIFFNPSGQRDPRRMDAHLSGTSQ